MSLHLNDDELIELTGFRQRAKQRAALVQLGYKFRTRPADGFPLVLRDQFKTEPRSGSVKSPDWSALGQ